MRQGFLRQDVFDYYMSVAKVLHGQIVSSTFNTIDIPSLQDMDISRIELVIAELNGAETHNGRASITVDFVRGQIKVLSILDKENNPIPTRRY